MIDSGGTISIWEGRTVGVFDDLNEADIRHGGGIPLCSEKRDASQEMVKASSLFSPRFEKEIELWELRPMSSSTASDEGNEFFKLDITESGASKSP